MNHSQNPVERIAAVRRARPITDDQREDAARLLEDLLQAAATHGVELADFDWLVDLPGACLDVTLRKSPR